MKIECPHCYQHYEINRSDLDRELICINCEQSFRVRDALVLDQQLPQPRRLSIWLMSVSGTLIVLLLALNLWNWQRLVELRAATVAGKSVCVGPDMAARSQEDMQTVIAPLYRTLKEMRNGSEQMARRTAELEQAVAELKTRLDRMGQTASPAVGTDRVASLEEGLHTQTVKLEGLVAQINLLDEYHKQLLKGLTELRSEIQVLNIRDRLNLLEKKVDGIDLDPVNRRIDKLDAVVNAMRTIR